MHVELKEMSATEAAAYATDVFAAVSIHLQQYIRINAPGKIALSAQSRQSRLNPSAVPLASTSSVLSRMPKYSRN
jgi:hypothetical protein